MGKIHTPSVGFHGSPARSPWSAISLPLLYLIGFSLVSVRIRVCFFPCVLPTTGWADTEDFPGLEKEYPDGLLIGLAISGGGFRGNATGDEDARRPEHDIRI